MAGSSPPWRIERDGQGGAGGGEVGLFNTRHPKRTILTLVSRTLPELGKKKRGNRRNREYKEEA